LKNNFQFLEENMRIDFNEIASMTFPGMDNGTGMMSARMYNDDSYRIIPTAIHPGGRSETRGYAHLSPGV
jgi:hypothetical protein